MRSGQIIMASPLTCSIKDRRDLCGFNKIAPKFGVSVTFSCRKFAKFSENPDAYDLAIYKLNVTYQKYAKCVSPPGDSHGWE